jgi:hypothetical protein
VHTRMWYGSHNDFLAGTSITRFLTLGSIFGLCSRASFPTSSFLLSRCLSRGKSRENRAMPLQRPAVIVPRISLG